MEHLFKGWETGEEFLMCGHFKFEKFMKWPNGDIKYVFEGMEQKQR